MAIIKTRGNCYQWDGEDGFNIINHPSVYYNRTSRRKNVVKISRPGLKFSRDKIVPTQRIIASVLAIYCDKFELCGSYRRGKKYIKDLDYVCQTSPEFFTEIRRKLTVLGVTFNRGGESIMIGTIDGISVDFFRATRDNYVSQIIFRTGSKKHNIRCASIAKQQNMKINANGIVLPDGEIYHPTSEHDFYKFIGIDYIPPKKRDME